MTDRIHSLVIVLEHDMRDDDVEPLIMAIKQLRGVISVSSEVADMASHMAEERAKRELGQKLMAVIFPD